MAIGKYESEYSAGDVAYYLKFTRDSMEVLKGTIRVVDIKAIYNEETCITTHDTEYMLSVNDEDHRVDDDDLFGSQEDILEFLKERVEASFHLFNKGDNNVKNRS